MQFTLKISLDNADAQYEDGTLNEHALGDYLRQVAQRVEDYNTSGNVMDENGRTIGEYVVRND